MPKGLEQLLKAWTQSSKSAFYKARQAALEELYPVYHATHPSTLPKIQERGLLPLYHQMEPSELKELLRDRMLDGDNVANHYGRVSYFGRTQKMLIYTK